MGENCSDPGKNDGGSHKEVAAEVMRSDEILRRFGSRTDRVWYWIGGGSEKERSPS